MSSDGINWPPNYPRTAAEDREPYPGDLSPTRKESFESVVDELERWGATDVDISTASQHYADRPNIPHQHDKPDDVGVVARFRREGEAADSGYAIACDRWESQRENARAIALYARRMRLAERCGVTTASSTFETARLPPAQEDDVVVAEASRAPHDVLEVAPDAPAHVVRGAYRELLQERHPDKGGSREEFVELQEAKEAMLDD
ncbi:J domain-containing protein [Haloferax volcanii]|uniref:J domain-containing protein n=1 Tax=Haloferax volcanii TaxID=2246 RepID=UPI002499BFDA|nr:J domain-containing protein [Haloferax alexandrinus]WEL29829.1 DnaJ domain-containing protein [Haloferax alexandrinus]